MAATWIWSGLDWIHRLKGTPIENTEHAGFEGILLNTDVTIGYIPLLANPLIVWPEYYKLKIFFMKARKFNVCLFKLIV